jgi:hypothetical protein
MSRATRSACLLATCAVGAGLIACDGGSIEPPVDAIALGQVADTVEVGHADTLRATLNAGAAAVTDVSGVWWTSSNPAVFAVDSVTGVGMALAVAAPQAVVVTARYKTLHAELPVLVIPEVVGLRLLVSANVAVGHTVTPVAGLQGTPPSGTYSEASASWGVQFESANPGIMRVNTNGTLTAVSLGTARIRVTLHGKRDSADVAVMSGYPITMLAAADIFGVLDVNDSGEVVGNRASPTAILLRNGAQVVLGTCLARGINNRSQVLCGSSIYTNGQVTDVFGSGPFAGAATGINETGDVFGLLGSPDSLRNRAFVWRAGTINVYARLEDGVSLTQTGHLNVADNGLGQTASLYSSPLILRAQSATFLAPVVGRYAVARDINDAENVVGSTENTTLAGFAVLWPKSQSYNGIILGPRTTVATGISERDDVAGLGADGVFVWKAGVYTVLSDAVAEQGWTFANEPVISRTGIVAAFASNADGRRGVVLVRLP